MARSCIAARVRRLNRVVTNVYDDALRPHKLKVSQLNILVVTASLGIAEPARICEALQLDISTFSRNVERMRASGWLEVVPGPGCPHTVFPSHSQRKPVGKSCDSGVGRSPAPRQRIAWERGGRPS
jgi:hypothetical protein